MYVILIINIRKYIECCTSGESTGSLSGCGCQVCAKAAQEPCGGSWDTTGRCASGLNCLMKWGLYMFVLFLRILFILLMTKFLIHTFFC